jgi:hypothetical protein
MSQHECMKHFDDQPLDHFLGLAASKYYNKKKNKYHTKKKKKHFHDSMHALEDSLTISTQMAMTVGLDSMHEPEKDTPRSYGKKNLS